MILGYDDAVRYPVKDLYDTGMMKLYIGAIKDEYERGIKEQEDFISKYGDFISPFKKDVETWDRLTIDPIVQMYDDMQEHGIDPLRSQEGRALLASARRRVPRDMLSQLRQSAAAGQEYLQNRAKLQAEGVYNSDFENFLLNGASFEDWDTTQSGMWDRTSPVEYKGLRTLTDPWFKNRTKKFDAELTKKRNDGYLWYTYTADDMKQAANDQIQAFLGSDYGRYFYDRALQRARQSATPDESEAAIRSRANDILLDDIVAANGDYLQEVPEVNPYAMADYKFRQDVALEGIKHRNRMREAAAATEQPAVYPGSWTGMLTDEINKAKGSSKKDKLVAGIRDLIAGNEAQMKRYMVPGQPGKIYKKYQKQYDFHKKQRDYYKEYLKNVESGKAGFVRDKFGNYDFTDRARYVINRYNAKQTKAVGTVQGQTDWLNQNSIEIPTGYSRQKALDYVSTTPVEITNKNGVKEQKLQMIFGDTNNLTRVRVGRLMNKPLTQKSISTQLNNFLRRNKVTGYVDPTSIKVSKTARHNGGSYYDFTYYVDVPKSVIQDFINKYDSESNYNEALKKLGASEYVYSYGSGSYKTDIPMVRLSATKTASDGDLNAFVNSQTDNELYGASAANSYAPNRQAEAILNSYN